MLCGFGSRFNLLGGDVFGRVSDKRSSEDREQPVGFQTAEALGRFHHACRRPAEGHGGISPSLHIATEATHRPHHVLTAFAEQFIAHLLARNSRVEEDLVDQLFNSSEKRPARTLLLLANFGKEGRLESIIAKISRETLARDAWHDAISREFFHEQILIDYNGRIEVRSSLWNLVLHDRPQIKT